MTRSIQVTKKPLKVFKHGSNRMGRLRTWKYLFECRVKSELEYVEQEWLNGNSVGGFHSLVLRWKWLEIELDWSGKYREVRFWMAKLAGHTETWQRVWEREWSKRIHEDYSQIFNSFKWIMMFITKWRNTGKGKV